MNQEDLDYIGGIVKSRTQTKAIQGLEGDSATAAQSVDLEKSTGADAQMIYSNNEAFTKDYKSYLTQRMLDRNPGIAAYIDSHPMAAIVSKDDWDKMADFYDKLDLFNKRTHGMIPGVGVIAAVHGFASSFWDEMKAYEAGSASKPSEEFEREHPGAQAATAEFAQEHPYLAEAGKAAINVPQTAMQIISAAAAGVRGAVKGAAIAEGASPEQVRRAETAAGATVEYLMTDMAGSGFHGPTAEVAQIARAARELEIPITEAAKAIRVAEPYLKKGELPPLGAHPVWDGVIAENTKQQMSIYDAVVDAVDKTETKELSPEMMAKAIAVANKEDIYLHWDAVQKLYGDKVPEPGDGLLGDIPGIQEQIKNAIDAQTDIQIPLSEWLAKIEPEVRDGLHDDVRLRANDASLNEVKDIPPVEKALDDLQHPTEPVTPEPLPEEPGLRMTRLRVEYKDRLNTHRDIEGKPEDQNLLQSLKAVTGYEFNPERISKAVEWAWLNDRPDIVDRALELARLSDPALEARLNTELGTMHKANEAQHAVAREMASRPLFPIPEAPQTVRLVKPGKPRLSLPGLKGEHSFDIVDQNGKAVASLEMTPRDGGKDLHIDFIGGISTPGRYFPGVAGMLGPKNIRLLLDDLIKQFPEAETISGTRISGVRELKPKEVQRVKISIKELREKADAPGWDTAEPGPAWDSLKDLIASGEWEQLGPTTAIKATPEFQTARQTLGQRLIETARRFVGDKSRLEVTIGDEIRMGKDAAYPVQGLYLSFRDKDPILAIALNSIDPARTLRHETIHHLRTYGFFTDAEWETLSKASRDKWIKEHNILDRYKGQSAENLIEEGVAEGFAHWKQAPEAETAIGRLFQRIADFLDQLRIAIKEAFGKDLTEEEIFKSIESGRIGQRGPGEPMYGAKDIREPMAQEFEVPKIEEEGLMGILPKGEEEKYLRRINELNSKDVKEIHDIARKEAAKRETPIWKARYAIQYGESMMELKNRPDFRAAAFFRNGVFKDTKLDGLPKLDPSTLTPEQVQALPSRWMSKSTGFNADVLAESFGYRTGQEMIDALVRFETAKGRQKIENFLERMARNEAERRMEMQYGKLDDIIMQEAREHAIGLTRFDLMHQETMALASRLGQTFTLTKKDFENRAKLAFNEAGSSQVSLEKYIKDIGKSNKFVQDRLLVKDYASAYVERQNTLHLHALADLTKQFNKEKAALERTLNRFKTAEPTNVPAEFANWIHAIMHQIDRAPRRGLEAVWDNIAQHDEQTLEKFSARYSMDGLPHDLEELGVELNSSLPIAQELMATDQDGRIAWNKPLDKTTVGEYRAIGGTLQALATVGRRELKAIVQGKEIDYLTHLNKLKAEAEKLGEAWQPNLEKNKLVKARLVLQHIRAGLTQMEFVWDRLDRGDSRGIFSKTFGDMFAEAGSEYRILEHQISREVVDLRKHNEGVNLKEKLAHDVFYDPLWGLPKEGKPPEAQHRLLNGGRLTRNNLRAIMMNVGNASNLDKLARGYGTTPEKIMEWVNRHATEKDWAFVQDLGKVFERLQDKADLMTMNMTGYKMERLPVGKVATNFGEIDGWYYPMIYSREKGGGRRPGEVEPNPPPLLRTVTAHGWERKRTGYAGPVDMTLADLPNQLTRRIRDLAFRESLATAGKFFKDQRFRDMMTQHMGQSYTDLLTPYLEDIAGSRGYNHPAIQSVDSVLNWLQRNTIHVLIGFKPTTMVKHSLTAYTQSFGEVGSKYMVQATKDLFSSTPAFMKANHEFIMNGGKIGNLDWEGSGVIRGRKRNWEEHFGVAVDLVTGRPTLGDRSQHWAAYGVALSDQMASKALWLAKYREVMDELKPKDAAQLKDYRVEEAHTEAVTQADMAVRRTHGETVVTSRPQYMRTPILRNLTGLYSFFNHFFNRFYRMSWQTAELMKNIPKGEATMADATHLAGAFFLNVVAPAYIEYWVSNQPNHEDEGLIHKHFRIMMHPIMGSVPLLREAYYAIEHGVDPGFGLLQTTMKMASDFTRIMHRDLGKEDIGDVIQSTNNLVGVATRLPFLTDQTGRWMKFGYNYMNHYDRPKTWEEWRRAFQTGKSEEPRQRR